MLPPEGKVFANTPPVLHAALELRPQIQAAGDEMERIRRISPEIAQAMKGAGVFGMVLPRSWGAPELDPLTQIRVIEALAMAEGSAGWGGVSWFATGDMTPLFSGGAPRGKYAGIF